MIRARWKLGRLLRQIEKGKTGPKGKEIITSHGGKQLMALYKEWGLDKNRASEAQRIGTLPEPKLIKDMRPEISNRAIGRAVGIAHTSVVPRAPAKAEKPNENSAGVVRSAPSLAGSAAAKLVQRREEGKQKRLDTVAADEQRRGQANPRSTSACDSTARMSRSLGT
jgi:hypothetical protein